MGMIGQMQHEDWQSQREEAQMQRDGEQTERDGGQTRREGGQTQRDGEQTQREGVQSQREGVPSQHEGEQTQRQGQRAQEAHRAPEAPPAAPERPAHLPKRAASRLLRVTHETRYRYAARVESAQHLARLTPLEAARQQLIDFALEVEPAPEGLSEEIDAFGNVRISFGLNQPHEGLYVRSRSLVRVVPSPRAAAKRGVMPEAIAAPAGCSTPWEQVRERLSYRAGQPYDSASEFVFASTHIACHPDLAAYAMPSFAPGRPLVQAAWDLMRRIHADFAYIPQSTDVNTSALDSLALRKGVCQYFAHVMIGAMRSLGLAARYVSGYLLTQPPPGQPRLIGADASHAWVEVYDPAWPEDRGWLQLDPTNDRAPGDDYVMLSIGRDYADVAPLRGVIRGGGADQVLSVGVTVEPWDEGAPAPAETRGG